MITKKEIEEMSDGVPVSGYVVFQNIEERLTRNNTSSFLTGNLQCQGQIPFKVWSNAPCFSDLRDNTTAYTGIVCEIAGKVNIYDGRTSIIVENCRYARGKDVPDVMDFYESRYDANRFWDSLVATLKKNCSPEAMAVFDTIMEPYKEGFMVEFAAIGHHDACKSGLLGHTTKGVKIASVLGMYPNILSRCGKDALFVGFALHDIGKVLEYSNGAISKMGTKISHMISGCLIIAENRDFIIDTMGEDFYYDILSVVSSHAGEFGERSRTLVSYIAHLIDDFESKLTTLNELAVNPQQIYFDDCKLN